MPPFSTPVASTSSLIEAPAYPRWLKTGAARSRMRRRVASPLRSRVVVVIRSPSKPTVRSQSMRGREAGCNVTWDTARGAPALRYRPEHVRTVRAGVVAGAARRAVRRRRAGDTGARVELQRGAPGERVRGARPRRGTGAPALSLRAALGADPVVGEGPQGRRPHDQRPGRVAGRQVGVRARLPAAPLPRAGGGLLRVAAPGWAQAADVHPPS